MDASLRLGFVQHDIWCNCAHSFLSCRALFRVIPSEARNPYNNSTRNTRIRRIAHGLTFPFLQRNPLMDASLRLRSVQHDIWCNSAHSFLSCRALFCHFGHFLFCHSERSEESIFGTACLVWIASVALRPCNDAGGLISQSLTRPTVVMPSQSEESSAMWMLHCADAPFSMTERACGCPAGQVRLTAYSRKQFVSLSFPRIKKTMYENTHLRQH